MTDQAAASEDRRRFDRFELTDIRAFAGRDAFQVVNVSAEGVLLEGLDPALAEGDTLHLTLTIPIMRRIVSLPLRGRVARREGLSVGIHFVEPARSWSRLLELMAQRQSA
ncbi:MAG: PilZ domain-containing protein [Magnetospiraceae bacterium]